MKYTRYDMKRRRNSNSVFGVILFSTLIFAFIIGTLIYSLLLKNINFNDVLPKPNTNVVENMKNNVEKKNVKYIVIQHGMFTKAENIEQGKNKLNSFGNPFTVQDEKGTRVLLGIYSEEESLKIIKILNDNGIENSKMVFEIDVANSLCEEEISAIISAELDILTKLSDKNIKSIQTEDLKKWCSELKEVEKTSDNVSVLNELKSHISNLPKELIKEKTPEYYDFIYKTLKKLNFK